MSSRARSLAASWRKPNRWAFPSWTKPRSAHCSAYNKAASFELKAMYRPFAFVTLALTATMDFMIGLIVAGSARPAPALTQLQSGTDRPARLVDTHVARSAAPVSGHPAGLVNF